MVVHCLYPFIQVVGQPYPDNVRQLEGLHTVTISNFAEYNKGPYICVVKNSCGTAYKYALITVS